MDSSTKTVDSALEHDATEFHRALSDLIRVYQFRDRKRICCNDISVTQCYALEALSRHDGMTLRELAEAMFLDNSTTSRVVDTLEKKGLTTRDPDPHDGRQVHIQATAAGRDLHNRVERDLIDEHKRLLAEFEPEFRRAATRLIARLGRRAHEKVSRVDGRCCVTES